MTIRDVEIGKQVHVMFESHNECDCYTVVVVKDGMVVRLLFKAVSRLLAELHMLSKVLFLN